MEAEIFSIHTICVVCTINSDAFFVKRLFYSRAGKYSEKNVGTFSRNFYERSVVCSLHPEFCPKISSLKLDMTPNYRHTSFLMDRECTPNPLQSPLKEQLIIASKLPLKPKKFRESKNLRSIIILTRKTVKSVKNWEIYCCSDFTWNQFWPIYNLNSQVV